MKQIVNNTQLGRPTWWISQEEVSSIVQTKVDYVTLVDNRILADIHNAIRDGVEENASEIS